MAKHPPPWLFALTGMPYGVVGSFSTLVVAFRARNAGIEVGDIGWFQLLLFVPPMVQFLYTPVIDFGPKRKHWLVIVATLGAACLVGACLMPLPSQLLPFLVFAFVGQTVSGLVGSCNGGLMAATIPDEKRGAAGAWYNVGNLSGGGLSGALAIYMTGHGFEPLLVGLTLAAMMILPALAALAIPEPERDKAGTVGEALGATVRDVRGVLLSHVGITGILLCLSPVGTAALANYFTAIGVDYVHSELPAQVASPELVTTVGHLLWLDATEARRLAEATLFDLAAQERAADLLAWLQGPVGQILTALGALGGGVLCDRFNRRAMYLLSGTLTAVIGLAMAFSPPTEATFTWGVLTYSLVTGFCYAAFSATVLETIGDGGKTAATQYSLFVASGNAAIAWVGFVNTRFHDQHGVEGVVFSDAALNLAGVVVLGLVFWRLGLFKRRLRPRAE